MQTQKQENDFYADYSKVFYLQADQVNQFVSKPGQPSFLQIYSVDNQYVALINEEPIDAELLVGTIMRINQMILPIRSQLVDIDSIKSRLGGDPCDPIDLHGILRDQTVAESVLMNICGMIIDPNNSSEPPRRDRHFHPCHGSPASFGSQNGGLHTDDHGTYTCDLAFLATNQFTDAKNKADTTVLNSYGLILFYISREDIEQTDSEAEDPGSPYYKNEATIAERLKAYFKDGVYGKYNKKCEGVFLIPRLMADQSVSYLCLLNSPIRKKYKKNSVKNRLNQWLSCVEELNQDSAGKEVIIEGDDLFFCAIDQWSVLIGRHAIPRVASTI
ncbi:MAG: hypothetical protein KTR30_18790 [Saprospiraceae bacterium]|nr:hypothetical protein [Saprospiraceae bacterium]